MENKNKVTSNAGPAQPNGVSNCYIQPYMPVYGQQTCPCCGGSGTQVRLDGIKIICPGCGGTGSVNIPVTPIQPYYPQPFYPQPWQGPWVVTNNSLPETKK